MRFSIVLKLKNKEMPRDYRRKFISFLKKSFEEYDEVIFKRYYEGNKNIEKPYTFSIYLGRPKFEENKIVLENDMIYLNFSTHDIEAGLHFYNAVLAMKGKDFQLGDSNKMTVEKINLIKEKMIIEDKVVFKTLSPILIREHNKEKNRDWYYEFAEENSMSTLRRNIEQQIINYFGESAKYDLESLVIKPLRTRKVVMDNYDIKITGNIGTIEIQGKPYLLDYFYKSGLGSRRAMGFSMLDIAR